MLYDVIYIGRILRIAIGIMVLFSVMAVGAGAAKIIKDNATGGDCSLFGTWTAGTKTCTMTIDLNETIQIDSNSLTLDGNGHTLTGTESQYSFGIYFTGRNGITIKNMKIKGFGYGVYFAFSNNNYLTNNNASNNGHNIYSIASNNNTLNSNNASNNGYGVGISIDGSSNTLIGNNASNNGYGIELRGSPDNNVMINNYANSNTIFGIGLCGTSNTLIGNNASKNKGAGIGISCSSIRNHTLSGNTANYNMYGIQLDGSSNTLFGNNANSNTETGIDLGGSSSNTLIGNNANSNNNNGIELGYSNNLSGNNASSNTGNGIQLDGSGNNLSGNNANLNQGCGLQLDSSNSNILIGNNANLNQGCGISLLSPGYRGSDNNLIIGNNASSNKDYGFYILSSNSNTLSGNNASNNYYGVYISSSINNTIFNNLFINNNNFESSTSSNIWNTTKTPGLNIIGGPYLGGNVWANPDGTGFSQTCPDVNDDGICDPSYTLDASNIDYLPISMDFTKDMIPPKRVSKLKNVSYASAFINWTWTDPSDPDFELVEIYINNIYKTSVQKGVQYYKAKKLYANRSYTISTRTKDQSGNINPIWKNKTALTKHDLAPPMNVTNLNNITYSNNYINWTWKNPKDDDFTKVIVFIDNEFKGNVSKGKKYYNATNFAANTEHIISTWTMDRNGNINKTWTNSSAWTAK